MSTDQAVARAGSTLLADVAILVRDTLTVFVRLFPQISAVWLLGWLGDEVATQVAGVVGDGSGWAAVAIFSTSFLFDLVAVVVVLRLCGRELGIAALIPESEAVADRRDESLSRVVAVTLLPFLGLYAAFGLVQEKAAQLTYQQTLRGAIASGGPSVLTSVRGLATDHPGAMLALLVGLYVLRRLLDALHERTGIRPLGVLTAAVESFFILVVIYGGFLLLARPGRWLTSRQYTVWLESLGRAVEHALASLNLHLPDLLHRFFGFLADPVWPLFLAVVSQPIIWLAVAALVYGSQVLSLAELWRRGQPTAARVIGASVFDRRGDRRQALALTPPRGLVRVGTEVREAFLGDVDDKYLPTFHSLRLVLRAGSTFLGGFVLVYTAVIVLQNYVQKLYEAVVGGQPVYYWVKVGPLLDLVDQYPWEPLRLCLLAVAFRRCLELFQQRSGDGTVPDVVPDVVPGAEAPLEPGVPR